MNVLKYAKKDNKILIMMHVESLTSRMDTSIYIGLGLQLLSQIINVRVDVPWKRIEYGHASFLCVLQPETNL